MKKLQIKHNNGKVFELSKNHDGFWEVMENRGADGRFQAFLPWWRAEKFLSLVRAYAYMKNNINEFI